MKIVSQAIKCNVNLMFRELFKMSIILDAYLFLKNTKRNSDIFENFEQRKQSLKYNIRFDDTEKT